MSRLENNRYAIGFQLTSRMSRQVLPPSTKPLHLPILPFPSVATVTYRRVARSEAIYKKLILQDALQGATFSDAQVRGCPYMSTVSGQCPLSDVAALCFSPPSQRECVREHTRARTHATGSHGVISMECLGRLGSKKSGRVSSCVCVHPREFSSSVAYPRTPLPSLPTSENSSWCTFLRVRNLRDRALLS